jgi:AcrR family transcriptional regulator
MTTRAKKSPGTPVKAAARKTMKRSPGRPTGAGSAMLDRETILSLSFQLTKSVPLTELSIVRVARELGVTPALIHYYLGGRNDLGGRDALTSGVMNAFYRELVEQWPPETGDWKHNIEVVAYAVYRAHLRYPGIAMYVSTHNRYQMVQDVGEGETDFGLVFFEKFLATVRQAGFDAERTGTYAHLLIMFVTSSAHATVTHRWPGQHSEFLSAKLAALDPADFPSTHFVLKSFTHLNAAEAFATGLLLMVQSLELERGRKPAK